jgi:hypothetical protein
MIAFVHGISLVVPSLLIRNPAVDAALLIAGFLLASAGGLLALGLVAAAIFDPATGPEVAGGGLILGLPPLVLGLFLFFRGTSRTTTWTRVEREARGLPG